MIMPAFDAIFFAPAAYARYAYALYAMLRMLLLLPLPPYYDTPRFFSPIQYMPTSCFHITPLRHA